jgi:hypothetical protein
MRATTIAPTGPPPLRKRCVAGGVGEQREQRRDGGSQKKLTTVHDPPKRDRVADTGIRGYGERKLAVRPARMFAGSSRRRTARQIARRYDSHGWLRTNEFSNRYDVRYRRPRS